MTGARSAFSIGNVEVGQADRPPFLIAGPCVLEEPERTLRIAERAAEIADRHGFGYIFKASFDKANRSSIDSYRGPGFEQGLEWLGRVKERLGLPLLTDVHDPSQIGPVSEVVDCLQIPAFLCRQTDLLVAAAASGRVVNVKKGQFVSPEGMENAVGKVVASGCDRVLLTERGFSFGYNNLVVDYRGLDIMGRLAPVVFDATHAVQRPGGLGKSSGGDREMVAPLARAAVAVGVSGLFMEVHEDPSVALSDGPNMLSLEALDEILPVLARIDAARRS